MTARWQRNRNMNNRQICKKDHKREGAVKKSRLTAIAVIAVVAIGAPGEAQAQAPLGAGLAAELDTHSVAQAASSSTASVLSDQAQTQLQVQTATSSAMGGTGGSAHNAGNSQIMNIGGYGARNNPNIGLGLMVPTAPCRDTYSIAASAAGMGGALGWSKADRECRWQDIGPAFIRAGFIEDGLAKWCAIEGVEDIAPTCQRLKAAKELATRSAQTRPRSLDASEQ
jgi:hypothetical protein